MRKMALLRRISTRFCYGYPVVLLEKHPKSASLSLPHLRLRLSTNVKRRQSSSFPLQTNPVPSLLTARLYSSPADRDGTSEKLTFEEYRKLRKSLKLRGRVAGLPMAFLGMGISSVINVHFNPNMFNQTPEEVELILGQDPVVFSALCGVASGIAGYILGGSLFHATWKLMFKKKATALKERDNDFLERVQKYRFSQVSRYDDDYYADKVMTLSDYRQWVRQQQKRQEQLESTAAKGKTTDTEPTQKS